jgi:hypothetical protein
LRLPECRYFQRKVGHSRAALGAWVEQLSARTHRNIAVVALANKMARIAWVILHKSERYRPAALAQVRHRTADLSDFPIRDGDNYFICNGGFGKIDVV